MRVVFAADHAAFALKEVLKPFVASLGYDVIDAGAHTLDMEDDYVPFMQKAARMVLNDPANTRAVIMGASGQGEAIAANRFKGIRAAVYYGEPERTQVDAKGKELDMVSSTREHNDANILSLGARFLSEEKAKQAVKEWLEIPFTGVERHARRIRQLDENL